VPVEQLDGAELPAPERPVQVGDAGGYGSLSWMSDSE
jgi:hypothetical protein